MHHHIQKGILNVLASAKSCRYNELKPPELDGNTFGYHLKALISDKYIYKTDDGKYTLTTKGKDYIVRRYEDPSRSAHSIYLIVIKNESSYLLRRRKVQPLLGYTGFIHGEPEPGKYIIDSARERLLEKTGLDIALTVKGSAIISQYIDMELQSYSHAVILYGETIRSDIINEDKTGANYWGNLDKAPKLLPSCHDIIAVINSDETWFEKDYHL